MAEASPWSGVGWGTMGGEVGHHRSAPRRDKDVIAMTRDEHNTPALDAAHLAALRARLEAERVRLRGILQGLDAEVQAAEPPDEPEDYGEMGRDLMQEG